MADVVGEMRSSRYLCIAEVLARVPLSKATIYRRVKENDFPKPVSFGNRVSRWLEPEVDAWIQERIDARNV